MEKQSPLELTLVQEFVGKSHADLDGVRELLVVRLKSKST